MPAATPAETDRSLSELRDGATRWIALPPGAKAALFERVRDATYAQAERWANAAADAKGVAGTPLAGEELISGPWAVLYALNRYVRTLRDIERFGTPQFPCKRVRMRANRHVVVDVFPTTPYDGLLFNGIRAEVWMQPDVAPATLAQTMAVWYKRRDPQPRVAVVLAAGNISAIPPLDVFYKLIADGAVCILKMNPVSEYLGPIFEDALRPLVDEGFLRLAYGGADVGKFLCAHPLVDEVHVTGSATTHDRIVFGDGPDAAERKRRNDPVLHKPVTSELGNVSPTIVVPGKWTDADFKFQAEHIATQKMHNGGFNCVASQVLILPKSWDGTNKLLAQIGNVMDAIADRPAYYPGAAERCEALTDGHENISRFGKRGEEFTHRTIVNIEAHSFATAFETEAFSSVLAVTTLPGETGEFLKTATAFANERLWGTLGANIIVHPKTMHDFAGELDAAIAGLRFGCLGVNAWTGVAFLLTETPWGAYPGHTPDDVRSGIGVVHNSYLFDRTEKSVIYAPFAEFPRSVGRYGSTLLPKPPWFITNNAAHRTAKALLDFEMHKTPLNAMRVAMLALRG